MKSYMTTSIDRSPQNEYPLLKKRLFQAAFSIGLIFGLNTSLVGCSGEVHVPAPVTHEPLDTNPLKCRLTTGKSSIDCDDIKKRSEARSDQTEDYNQCYVRYQEYDTCKLRKGNPYITDKNGDIPGGVNNAKLKVP